MSLTSKEITLILNLLQEDKCGNALTFEQISTQFHQQISKSDFFRVANSLVLLIQNRDLTPTPQQRLIIFFLFYELYRSENQSIDLNPFSTIFISILQKHPNEISSTSTKHFYWLISPVTGHERWFVRNLLLHHQQQTNLKDLFKKTPNQILQMNLPAFVDEENQREIHDKIEERRRLLPSIVQCHLPAVIDDPQVNLYGFDALIGGPRQRLNDSQQTIERLLLNNAMENTIRPEFLRLAPPLHECSIDEFIWLSNVENDASNFHFDNSMCVVQNTNQEIRQLMEKAYRTALNLQQQQKLSAELDNDPTLVNNIGLVPSKLPLLVENNPLISIQCLLKLITSNQMTEYLSALVSMNMSLHSMEVVNRLSTSMPLPQEFLHLYISTCITTCEETKDRFLQNRFVRLVSVFVQSLIRNKVIDIKDLSLDIQGFCINFRHIKEAGSLFQLVKSYELRSNDINENSTTTTTGIPLTTADE